jgi:hypothetical protein
MVQIFESVKLYEEEISDRLNEVFIEEQERQKQVFDLQKKNTRLKRFAHGIVLVLESANYGFSLSPIGQKSRC